MPCQPASRESTIYAPLDEATEPATRTLWNCSCIWLQPVGCMASMWHVTRPVDLELPTHDSGSSYDQRESAMRLALSSYTYSWAVGVPGSLPAQPMTPLALLDRAVELQVDGVQIADNMPLHKLASDEVDMIAARAHQTGLHLELGTRGIDAEHLSRYVALARRLKSPILRVVIDQDDRHPSPEEALAELLPQRHTFEDAGVVLAIENHDRYSAATLAHLIRRLGPWAGVCLDTVNSFGALDGPREVLAHLGPLAVNLHVKDFSIQRAWHNLGFVIEGRPAGQGQLNVPWLLDALGRRTADLTAVIELWTPPEEDIEATVAKERVWAEQSVSYLREVIAVHTGGLAGASKPI